MSTTNIKKTLLVGTAIVAVGAFISSSAHAQTHTLTGAGTWAGAGTQGGVDDGTAGDATAGQTIDVDTNVLTITDDGTADDGGGAGTYTVGAITDTDTGAAGTGDVIVQSTAANAAVTANITSANVAGDFTVTNADADNLDVTANVTGALTTGTDVNVVNNENTSAADLALTVGGAASVGGVTNITAGTFAGGAATAAMSVTGNSTFTGAVTVTGGTNAASTSTLTLGGATNTFTGGLTLTDGAAGAAILTLNRATAQTVAGTIAGDGDINVNNAGGVTFSGGVTSGTVTVENTAGNSSARFQGAVTSALTLGTDGNAGDVNTVTFDGATAGFATNGAVAGTAAETNNIVVRGGNTINQAAGAWGGGGNISALTVTGNGTILDSDAAITATAITIGNNATLDVGAGALTGAVSLTGTLLLSGGGGVVGNVTGSSGTLDVDADATVQGSVTNLTSIDVADNVTLTIDATTGNESVSANSIVINDSGVDDGITFDLQGNTITLSSDVDTATGSQGLVTIDDSAGGGTMTITSDIGSSAASMGVLAVSGAGSNETVTTTGNLFVDTITLDDLDVLQFVGTSAQTVSGTVSGVGATDGVLTFGTGATATNVTLNGLVDIGGAMTVNALAQATFAAGGTSDTDGALTNNGTLQINSGDTLDVDSIAAGTGTFNIGLDRAGGTTTPGILIESGGAAIDFTDDTVHFIVEAGSQPLAAEVIQDVFQGTGAATGPVATTDNSFIFGFALADDGNNLDLTITVDNSINNSASTPGNAAVGNVLMTGLAASANAEINTLQGNIGAASSQAALNDVLEQVQSPVDGGAFVGALNVSNSSLSITGDQLAALRTGTETGMVAGNVAQGLRAWGQVFGSTADQDTRDSVSGYDADSYGIAVGIDTENIATDTVLGLAFSYADTEVDSKALHQANTEIDSYQITLYGDHDLDDRTYISGMLAYGRHDNDTSRIPAAGLIASGDFDADQYSVRAELGRDYQTGETTLTPSVMAHYTNYSPDGYTETGAGGANLTVDGDDLSVFELGIGVDASWMHKHSDGSYLRPELSAGVRHDLVGDEVEATSSFQGGGATFKSEGFDPAQTTFNLGAGIKYFSTDNWELTAEYDFEVKSDYDSHAGLLRAGYRF